MGFDFTVIVPLLLSHCGFSFVFGCGVSFLVSSSVFLSMIVQQLVVIQVFSQEGVRACPSTLPPWFLLIIHLVVQWTRIYLPMQGIRVQSLVWEDPICSGATKPRPLSLCSRAHTPQLLKPVRPETMLCSKRSHHNKKAAHRS